MRPRVRWWTLRPRARVWAAFSPLFPIRVTLSPSPHLLRCTMRAVLALVTSFRDIRSSRRRRTSIRCTLSQRFYSHVVVVDFSVPVPPPAVKIDSGARVKSQLKRGPEHPKLRADGFLLCSREVVAPKKKIALCYDVIPCHFQSLTVPCH